MGPLRQQRSPIRGISIPQGFQGFSQTEHRLSIQKNVNVVTTPTDPTARPIHWPSPSPKVRTPSGLQNMLTVDTSIETVSTTTTAVSATSTHAPIKSAMDMDGIQSPITIFSPTIINMHGPSTAEDLSALVRVPNPQHNIWSQVMATHVLSALVPSTMLRILFLGCLLDYCMIAMNERSAPSFMQYITHVLETAVY